MLQGGSVALGTIEGRSKNNYSTEMCSGSEAGSYSRLRDFVYHSTLGLRVIKKKKKQTAQAAAATRSNLTNGAKERESLLNL